ncbi:MAG: TetR/AcrR family transcriptional regulator [Candidatus Poseidoniales archaeon]|nr:MAG: TetR/AcrR family transcriptional regulator [Candidatus Poseidoniales archaeon]
MAEGAGESTFQRARSSEHQAVRRAAIVEAARRLLGKVHPLDLRMRALAKRAGISPSGLYRYFENMEAVLLHVHLCDFEDVVGSWEQSLHSGMFNDGNGLNDMAALMARSFLAEPRFLTLISLTPSLYEREVSVEALVEHKLQLLSLMQRAGAALQSTGVPIDDSETPRLFGQMLAFASGLHLLANPSPTARIALEHPALTFLALDMADELEEGLKVLLRGSC